MPYVLHFVPDFTDHEKDADAPVVSGLCTDGCSGYYGLDNTTARDYV